MGSSSTSRICLYVSAAAVKRWVLYCATARSNRRSTLSGSFSSCASSSGNCCSYSSAVLPPTTRLRLLSPLVPEEPEEPLSPSLLPDSSTLFLGGMSSITGSPVVVVDLSELAAVSSPLVLLDPSFSEEQADAPSDSINRAISTATSGANLRPPARKSLTCEHPPVRPSDTSSSLRNQHTEGILLDFY